MITNSNTKLVIKPPKNCYTCTNAKDHDLPILTLLPMM